MKFRQALPLRRAIKVGISLQTQRVRKLAFLITSLQVGGSERVAAMLANVLADDVGLEVDIIAYGPNRDVFYPLSTNVRLIQPDFEFNHRFRFLSTVRTLLFLRKMIRSGSYDVVLSFGERWNNFVMIARFALSGEVILWDRSSPEIDIGLVQSSLRRILYPRAAGLIAQTNAAREVALRRNFHTRVDVIPNPVIAFPLAQDRDRQNIILTVGRLIETKHHDRLIKIFASLDLSDWQLVIVGDDSLRQEHRERLIRLSRELGIADRVQFAGSQSDVQAYYDKAKIFAFTSSSEGLPNVIAEALAAGLPVVSYDCVAGPSDLIVDGENGFLTDVFDDIAFRKRLLSLISNEASRRAMSVAARQSIAHLTPGRIAEALVETFHRHTR